MSKKLQESSFVLSVAWLRYLPSYQLLDSNAFSHIHKCSGSEFHPCFILEWFTGFFEIAMAPWLPPGSLLVNHSFQDLSEITSTSYFLELLDWVQYTQLLLLKVKLLCFLLSQLIAPSLSKNTLLVVEWMVSQLLMELEIMMTFKVPNSDH